jgi:nicotinic acid mononucleotide adenylyltransferase
MGRPLPEGWNALDPGAGGRIFLLPIEPVPISSSLVRERAAHGGDLSTLVPPAVARYIRASKLYDRLEEHH